MRPHHAIDKRRSHTLASRREATHFMAPIDANANQRLWEQLLLFVEEGRVVPVVGPDLLQLDLDGRRVSLHAWLAERLAERLNVAPCQPGEALGNVAARHRHAGGEIEDVYGELSQIVRAADLPLPEPLRKLAAIRPLRLFVTTTFDPLLQRALDEVRFGGEPGTQVLSYRPEKWDDLPVLKHGDLAPTVYHLFGRLSSLQEYAVTDEDVLEFMHALQSESRRPTELLAYLRQQNGLLLGCNFADWLARFFLRLAKTDRLLRAGGKTDFVADGRMQQDAALKYFIKEFGGRTKVFTGNDAVEFVDELHTRWMSRPQPPADTPVDVELWMKPGSVFLSYASEDREAVETLRAGLDAAGIDVWFDRQDLKPGDAFKEKILANIDGASLFVPVLSRRAVASQRRFLYREWHRACEQVPEVRADLTFVVPVVIDDLPETDTAVPQQFRARQWARLPPSGRPDDAFVREVHKLQRDYLRAQRAAR